ncbi:MAG TPA: thermonuclease family protein [Verrucomicrobiae bacterium]|nr:thermonuclease family protein [Verrucomicrobiae bacterium]
MMRPPSKRLPLLLRLILFYSLGAVSPAAAMQAFPAKVVEVIDGDTIRVVHQKKPLVIRLQGVDAPELKQPYGQKAKEFAEELATGQGVMVVVVAQEKEEIIGDVIFKDGRSLSREIIRAGYGWWDRKYVDDPGLAVLMSDARRSKRGLWADPTPVAPCVFRLIH